MKKRQIFTIITCLIAAVFFTCVLIIGLKGEGFGIPAAEQGPRSNVYIQEVDAEEAEVDSIDVDWRGGPITFGYSPDNLIRITESARAPLAEQDQMDVSVKSGTLSVRWDSRWFRRWLNIGWFGPEDKELKVLVPEELAGKLLKLDISGVAGDVNLEGFTAENLDVSTVSGTIRLASCDAEEIDLSTVSGSVELEDVAGTEGLDISSTSGSITASRSTAGALSVETVSGTVSYAGKAETVEISSVSGAVEAELTACPTEADMNSVSGSLTMKLPAGAAFTAEHSSVSGDFSCDFTGESKGGRFLVGSGGGKLSMSTTSGDMAIERR